MSTSVWLFGWRRETKVSAAHYARRRCDPTELFAAVGFARDWLTELGAGQLGNPERVSDTLSRKFVLGLQGELREEPPPDPAMLGDIDYAERQ